MTPRDSVVSLARRVLGSTRLMVDPLCIGCAALGNMPETFGYAVGEEQALATIRAIFDGPITFVDTAASYGSGESERRIGIVLRERGGLPPGFVLSTKADRDLQTGDFSGNQVQRSIERSLNLLGLEPLPLVYLHDPEHTTFERAMAPGGPVEALHRYKDEGLIDHIGVAGGPIDVLTRYVESGAFEVVISHNRYTLLNVAADPLWTIAQQRGVAAINAAPYGSGILVKGPRAYPRYGYREATGTIQARAKHLEDICARYNVPLAAAALQFSLRDPRITSTIIGVSDSTQLVETSVLAQYPIPESVWDELRVVKPATDDIETP